MQFLKKHLTIHHLIAVIISISIFALLSLVLHSPINRIFNQLILQSDLGTSLLSINSSMPKNLLLPFVDIFLLLQMTTLSFLLSTGIEQYSGEIKLGLTLFLITSTLPFIISGFYLSTKKISLKEAIPSFTFTYILIIFVLSLLHENTYSISTIHFTLSYNIKWLTLLFLIVMGCYIGYQIHHKIFNKKAESNIKNSLNLAGKAIITNILLYFSIISVFIVGTFGMMKERLIYMFPSIPITEWFNLSIQTIITISSQVSAYLLGLVHLLPIGISINENDLVNNATFSISEGIVLNGDVSIGTYNLFILRDLLNKVPYDEYLIFLLAIPAIILFIIGYRAKIELTNWKTFIYFSLFYALIVTFIVSASSIEWMYSNINAPSNYILTLTFNPIKLLFSSFLLAIIGFSLGQWMKKLITKKFITNTLKQ